MNVKINHIVYVDGCINCPFNVGGYCGLENLKPIGPQYMPDWCRLNEDEIIIKKL